MTLKHKGGARGVSFIILKEPHNQEINTLVETKFYDVGLKTFWRPGDQTARHLNAAKQNSWKLSRKIFFKIRNLAQVTGAVKAGLISVNPVLGRNMTAGEQSNTRVIERSAESYGFCLKSQTAVF